MPDPWIKHPTTLTGESVDLIPLDKTHFGAFTGLARDRRIWGFYAVDGTDSAKSGNARDNLTKRNPAYYSLIEEEWPDTKPKLTALYEAKKKAPRILRYITLPPTPLPGRGEKNVLYKYLYNRWLHLPSPFGEGLGVRLCTVV